MRLRYKGKSISRYTRIWVDGAMVGAAVGIIGMWLVSQWP